jgi:hypothetical protein
MEMKRLRKYQHETQRAHLFENKNIFSKNICVLKANILGGGVFFEKIN